MDVPTGPVEPEQYTALGEITAGRRPGAGTAWGRHGARAGPYRPGTRAEEGVVGIVLSPAWEAMPDAHRICPRLDFVRTPERGRRPVPPSRS